MDVSNITIEITTVVSVVCTAIALVSFWFKMDKRITLLEREVRYLKEHDEITHKRIDSIQEEIKNK